MSSEIPLPPFRCWVELDPLALEHNVKTLRRRLPIGSKLLAVVKANAYGHGADLIVPLLASQVEMFGVANLDEAEAVLAAAPAAHVLLLSPALPWEYERAIKLGCIPWLSTEGEAFEYDETARRLGRTIEVHMKLDTGMGRLGALVDEAETLLHAIRASDRLRLTGVASHMPVADEDTEFTRAQAESFFEILSRLELQDLLVHIQNSAGVLGYSIEGAALARAGLALYGISPLAEMQSHLRPVLTWKARVTLVRDLPPGHGVSYGRTFITSRRTRIATLAVGYADGYQRHLTGSGASVLLEGKRCPLLGRVTMDQIIVDVTEAPGVRTGDAAVLIGKQGGEEILASELAERSGTIAWEIFTGIGPRVARIVHEGDPQLKSSAQAV